MPVEEGDGQPIAHWSIRVTGRVQGVFFRAAAAEQGRALGLTGEARNRQDGSVQIEVEGRVAGLERFRQWCLHGPPNAEVSGVEVAESEMRNYPPGSFERR